MEDKVIAEVSFAKCSEGSRMSPGGVFVVFVTEENIVPGDFVNVKLRSKLYSFEVVEVETDDIDWIKATAKQTDRGRDGMQAKSNFDLRYLIKAAVTMLTDEKEIAAIRRAANMC